MKDHHIDKLENTDRIKELSPEDTLKKAGLKEDMILVDIGAGTGIFSFAGATITETKVYALEISDKMLEFLREKKAKNKVENLEILKVASDILPLEDNMCDLAIMVTVLHEIEDKKTLLNEIKRILKKDGSLLVVEFHKRETPMGPPVGHRIAEKEVEETCQNRGFNKKDKFNLGDNFYALLFKLSNQGQE